MTLPSGARLGHYTVSGLLGAGGMGEVYRAHDTRLGRDVAIKVLAPHLAATPEVRARFEREARTISQLNHPHICTLHDVGRDEGVDFLVMELLEGETLAHRLERGPLPPAEVLSLGVQIADALDRAHRAGVVHRDLKPGNVMLTRSGAKLMDFGLARVAGLSPVPGVQTESPTVSRPLTAEGTIVGTFQYMAPEQLEGKEADARADLWALGCVLYEMATGRRAFEGKSQASLIAAIMEREPVPPSRVVPLLPPTLDRVVQQCLTKDPDERIQTAHDVKLQLQWIAEGGSQAGIPLPVAAKRRRRERLAWTLASAAAVVAVLAVGSQLVLRRTEPPRVVRFEVNPPKGTTGISWPRVSPDGKTLAFLASDSSGVQRLWIRPVDSVDARPLEGMEGGSRPFWSPDSKYLAFITDGKLRKIPIAGGPAIGICDVPHGFDGTWGKSDWILFDGAGTDSIRGVPASGGTPKPITVIDHAHGETQHAWPYFLPDGERFLFVATDADGGRIVRMGKLGSLETRAVGRTETRAEYAPPGYLVTMSEGTLLAQPFDVGSARTTGDPIPVGVNVGGSVGDFSVSNAGVLTYQSAGSRGLARLQWVARDGRVLGEAAPPGPYEDVVLSPDEKRVALTIADAQPPVRDIWVRDLERGVSSRLTFDAGDELAPAWSPDGSRLAYAKIHGSGMWIFTKAASGVGFEDSLAHTPDSYEAPFQWSAATNTLVISHLGPPGKWEIWVMGDGGREAPKPFIQTPFRPFGGQISPDGRWMAYSSNESGRSEIYVVAYPGPGDKWQVSTAGGSTPLWRGDGKELFFQAADQSIMTVDVIAGSTLAVGVPKPLFKVALTQGPYPGYRWAVSRDGQRFLLNTPAGEGTEARFIVVTNWTAQVGGG